MQQYLYMTDKFRSDNETLIMNNLVSNYQSSFRNQPGIELKNSWQKSIEILQKHIPDHVPVVMEYVFPIGMHRVDFIAIGHKKAHLIEVKGWKSYEDVNGFTAIGNKKETIQPCYQLEDYLSKFKNFHSAAESFDFSGSVFMYNTTDGNQCELVYDPSEYEGKFSKSNLGIASQEDVDSIVKGKFAISETLINFIRENKEKILVKPQQTLVAKGFGLSEDQMIIMQTIKKSIQYGKRKVYLINGKVGSGKTLVALTILLDLYSSGIKGLLAYRNNRLINTLRRALGTNLSELLKFYSVGPMAMYSGIGEKNFDDSKLKEKMNFIIYDEAQRIKNIEMIRTCISRAPVTVFFYDEGQILGKDESGTRENFLKAIEEEGMEFQEFTLNSVFRMRWGDEVGDFIDSLLNGSAKPTPEDYSFNLYDNINEMLDELRIKESEDGGNKIALVAAWTESSGRDGDDIRVKSPEIRWLMNEKTEYPQDGMEQRDIFSKCASVYGSQGFESDYVGVIWGRDLVWRDSWEVNASAIMDNIGGKASLRSIAQNGNIELAKKLLINRYRILLSRGIKGISVYFEDQETYEHIRKMKESALDK